MGKRLFGLLVIAAMVLPSSGCIVEFFLLAEWSRGEQFYGSVDTAAALALCNLFTSPPGPQMLVTCSYGTPEYRSNATLSSEFGVAGVLIDPIVMELPADVTNVAGTFTGSVGNTGNLLVYPGLSAVPVDDTRTLTDEPGTQLIVAELPDGVPIAGVTYTFHLTYQRPMPDGDPGPTTFKALMTIKLRIGNRSYYAPMYPCTTNLASLPAMTVPQSETPIAATIPSGLPLCTAATTYRYARLPQLCDLDNDNDVDQGDLAVIAAREGFAASAGDPRDVNNDGTINAADVTTCRAQCMGGACPWNPQTYYLAEGATGPFFDTDLLLANPSTTAAPVSIQFLRQDGVAIPFSRTLPPTSRATIAVDQIAGLDSAAFSTVVTSVTNVPVVVERTMRWDASGYGAHTEKATSGAAPEWLFAEGSQGFFSTFFLLVNPQNAANAAHVTYLREGEAALTRDYPLAPLSRLTIDAGADPALIDRSFGARVVFDQPGAAERAMYFSEGGRLWSGGHASAGVTAPATSWFLAEGATGSFFTTFILLANPGATPANVTLTYLPDTGVPIVKTLTVPANQRVTRNIADEAPALAAAAVATQVQSSVPIVVERAQYWPNPAWNEAHNSAGVTDLGTRWGLAEGRVGGTSAYQTYVLLANPGTQSTDVTMTFLRTNGTTIVKTFNVGPTSRFTVAINGPASHVPELANESFGTLITSTQPIAVERALYNDANGITWAAGTNATATRLP